MHEVKLKLRYRWLQACKLFHLVVDEEEFESLRRHLEPRTLRLLEEWDE